MSNETKRGGPVWGLLTSLILLGGVCSCQPANPSAMAGRSGSDRPYLMSHHQDALEYQRRCDAYRTTVSDQWVRDVQALIWEEGNGRFPPAESSFFERMGTPDVETTLADILALLDGEKRKFWQGYQCEAEDGRIMPYLYSSSLKRFRDEAYQEDWCEVLGHNQVSAYCYFLSSDFPTMPFDTDTVLVFGFAEGRLLFYTRATDLPMDGKRRLMGRIPGTNQNE